MKIAILGWGSLVWDPGELRIVEGGWHKGGPTLPIELSRLSSGRRHFTYVIDPEHGRHVPTRYAISRYEQLDDAVCDLACREGCASSAIGYVTSQDTGAHRARPGVPWQEIRRWVKENESNAAIWTDLGPKLPEGWKEWSVDRALLYWQTMIPADKLADAARYASSAPAEVDTEFRRQLSDSGLIAKRGAVEIVDLRTTD
ncbi:MAG: hypothetical protein E6I60_10890 [Chloroflexi bacterium]|nr:MAG: hypothetical protein E6I60_10890 [Chloroflexota bacterium]